MAPSARVAIGKNKQIKETCGLKEVALLASDRQALAEGLSLLDMVAGATLPETPWIVRGAAPC
ncbi:hypothetical protein [Pseudomonas amygdali]|uniref:hypothetical protein n=1 Tax=Pseudomonas amygdali TaxID=47877 RepID=UPI001FB5F844|nr:hypothetical protein [Pseudomonas amygdali]